MAREFRLPDLGEGVTEGQIVRVLVREGDRIVEDQPLLEVETDKASVEIPSPHTGVVTGVHVTEQQIVNVGDVMVTFADPEDAATAVEVKPAAPSTRPRSPSAATDVRPAAPSVAGGRIKPASPAAFRNGSRSGPPGSPFSSAIRSVSARERPPAMAA